MSESHKLDDETIGFINAMLHMAENAEAELLTGPPDVGGWASRQDKADLEVYRGKQLTWQDVLHLCARSIRGKLSDRIVADGALWGCGFDDDEVISAAKELLASG